MNTLYKLIGALVFWFFVFGLFGWVDFRLCVGKAGTCERPSSSNTWKGAA